MSKNTKGFEELMKIEELREKLEAKKIEVRELNEANKIEEAEKALEEVRGLKKQIEIQEEIEAEEKRELQNQKTQEKRGSERMEKVNEKRAFVKAILGKELSKEERAAIKTSDNTILYPQEYLQGIEEIKKGYGSLKPLCDVIPVTKNNGTKAVVDLDQNDLKVVAEGDNIVEGSLVTSNISFDCKKYGLIDTLTSESVDDAEVEIESIVRGNFANIAVTKENVLIMKAVNDNAVKVEGTDYTALEDIMAKAVPAVKAGLITLVNVEGYAYLKNMKDKQGRNLNLITEVNGVEYFNGKPIYTFESALVAVETEGAKLFYSLNMKEAIKFFERKGISIAKSTEAGFSNDTVKIRILERFDVNKGPTRSIKKLEIA